MAPDGNGSGPGFRLHQFAADSAGPPVCTEVSHMRSRCRSQGAIPSCAVAGEGPGPRSAGVVQCAERSALREARTTWQQWHFARVGFDSGFAALKLFPSIWTRLLRYDDPVVTSVNGGVGALQRLFLRDRWHLHMRPARQECWTLRPAKLSAFGTQRFATHCLRCASMRARQPAARRPSAWIAPQEPKRRVHGTRALWTSVFRVFRVLTKPKGTKEY